MSQEEPVAAVDRLLAEAREGLDRGAPEDLEAEVAAGAMVIDIRPVEQRSRDGELPGALVVPRNVLEWRLGPTPPHPLPEAGGGGRGGGGGGAGAWSATRATPPAWPRPPCSSSATQTRPTSPEASRRCWSCVPGPVAEG